MLIKRYSIKGGVIILLLLLFLIAPSTWIRDYSNLHQLGPNLESVTLENGTGEHYSTIQIFDFGVRPVSQRRPFSNDPNCKSFYKGLYPEGSFNMTGLVSYPGSGNTWTRHLIELTTGVYTGSIYSDLDLFAQGFLGELEPYNSGSTITTKMHLNYNDFYGLSRAILLLRNPHQAIVSFVHFLEGGHTGTASPTTFKRKEWPIFVLGETHKWLTMARSWIKSPLPLLVVHYEDLKRDTRKEMRRICDFLQINCTSNLNSPCFSSQMDGKFKRRWRTLIAANVSKGFSSTQSNLPNWAKLKVDNGITYLSKLLVQNGHSPLPIKLYTK